MADAMIDIDHVSFAYGSESATETTDDANTAHAVRTANSESTESAEDSENTAVLGLKDVSLRVQPGECVLLCGASGCGKSTLLRLINGLVPNFHPGILTGSVVVANVDASASPLDVTGREVATVFQNPRTQFFTSDVRSELAFGPENFGMNPDVIRSRLMEAARRTGIEDLLNANLFRLSGGQKQLVACASSMVVKPQVHLFDEPTSNLSSESVALLRKVLLDLHASGATMVIAEHRLSYLRDIVDRVILLDGGRIVREMPAAHLWAMSERERTDLGLRALRPVTPMQPSLILHAEDEGSEKNGQGSTAHTTDDTSTQNAQDDATTRNARGLVLENLRFSYGSHQVLNIPRLELPRGRVTALVGPNGAGKSTLTRVLVGLERARGTIRLDGRIIRSKERTKLGYVVMQDVHRQLFGAEVREELTLGIPSKDLDDDRVDRILIDHGLTDVAERHPMSLSGGQKQRLVVAAAQMVDKEIYVFDEPSSGLDYRHLHSTAHTIRDLAEADKVVVIVTHDEELLAACADHVVKIQPLTRSL